MTVTKTKNTTQWKFSDSTAKPHHHSIHPSVHIGFLQFYINFDMLPIHSRSHARMYAHTHIRVWLIKSLRWAGWNGCNDYSTILWWIKSFSSWMWWVWVELSAYLQQAQMLRRSILEKVDTRICFICRYFRRRGCHTNKQTNTHLYEDWSLLTRRQISAKTNTFSIGIFIVFEDEK